MTTMAAVIERRPTATRAPPVSRIAHIDIISDLVAVEAVWRRLEQPEHFSTPYQRFDLLAAWLRNVGSCERLTPFIVLASDAERQPLLLLPLALTTQAGVRIAQFLGGKHATFNMGLWRRDFAQTATSADLDALVALIAAQGKADLLALTQQPQRWRDQFNPLALLPQQPSTNDCPLMTIDPAAPPTARISNSFRRRLKGKERKLQVLAGYRYLLAETDADIKRLLDAFFIYKPARMAAQKLPNVFADPGVEQFIRAACGTTLDGGGHVIDIHALQCDDEVIALFAGVADGQRFSMMFNTYTLSENARHSPGLILMRDIIDYYGERGYTSLDLGIGSDDYKLLFCKSQQPIFDSFVALSIRGRFAALAMSSWARLKRRVKQTPALMQLAQRLRSALQG
jgi:CelD/BcsL family acetyltransferase involved in cellulose biosynthesis